MLRWYRSMDLRCLNRCVNYLHKKNEKRINTIKQLTNSAGNWIKTATKKMKKTIMTAAVMAFLMGSFCATVSAMENTRKAKMEIVAGDNWDKVLDEYEKYVDQYIKTYKKAMSGDMSAMSEYVKLAEKAQKLADKLETAEDEMTTAQLKRYAKITEKMSKALLDN